MTKIVIRKAADKDNDELCRLFETPLQGNILLAMERNPDYFAGANIQCQKSETFICRVKDTSELVGSFSVGERVVYLNGKKTDVGYTSDLRVVSGYQKTRVLYEICGFLKNNNFYSKVFAQTVVFADNEEMLKVVGDSTKHSNIRPHYIPFGNYNTYMVPFLSNLNGGALNYKIRRANSVDVPVMQKFFEMEAPQKQLYPYYNFSRVGLDPYYKGISMENYFLAFENDELVGMAGVWDQSEFKQTKVISYSRRLKVLRPFINVVSFVNPAIFLPKEGTKLNYLPVHTILMKENNSDIFYDLYKRICEEYRKRGYQYLLFGLSENDSLGQALNTIKSKRIVKGKHFLVCYDKALVKDAKNNNYYLEAARI